MSLVAARGNINEALAGCNRRVRHGSSPTDGRRDALSPAIDALAAVGARARLDEDGVDVDPRIRALLDEIVAQVVGTDEVDAPMDPAVLGLARTLLSLGLDLIDHPDRSGLARRNVHDDGLHDRVEVRLQDATQLEDVTDFDASGSPCRSCPSRSFPTSSTLPDGRCGPAGW